MDRSTFLHRGFFPKEVPPSFSSSALGKAMQKWPVLTVPEIRSMNAKPARHSLARVGNARRILSIPNPIAHFALATAMESRWHEIANCTFSQISESTPQRRGAGQRAAVPREALSELPRLRARTRAMGRYLVSADIAEYYDSVYTHCIPWAFHGKAAAKQHRMNYAMIGNALDLAIRAGQGGQTKGIPIGPDTSFVLGEAILSSIDRDLFRRVSPRAAFRYFDDYELVFDTRSEAESALTELSEVVREHELTLNAMKSTVKELPAPSERSWILRIRDYEFGGKSVSPQRIFSFFDELFELRSSQNGAHLVGYAIARLESVTLRHDSVLLVEQLITQAVAAEPSAIQQYCRYLVGRALVGRAPARNYLHYLINGIIRIAGPSGHSNEVAWAVWLSLLFNVSIETSAVRVLEATRDSVVALLALDASARGLAAGLNKTAWQAAVAAPGSLYSEHWLLAYEGVMQGWLGGRSVVDGDRWFRRLAARGVRFYRSVLEVSEYLMEQLSVSRGDSYGDDEDDEDDDDDEDDEDDEDEIEEVGF